MKTATVVGSGIEALLTGCLAAATAIYAFQTRVPYPLWVMQAADKPWVMLAVLLVGMFLFPASPRPAALLILLTAALWMDIFLFANRPLFPDAGAPLAPPYGHDAGEDGHDSDSEDDDAMPSRVLPYDEPLSASGFEANGPAAPAMELPAPHYPMFFGMDIAPPGPAPF